MSAQRLRDAAAWIREVAEATGSLPWYEAQTCHQMVLSRPGASLLTSDQSHDEMRAEGDHIALWSPPVALAVADWLDDFANSALAWTERPGAEQMDQKSACLALADLILGGAS